MSTTTSNPAGTTYRATDDQLNVINPPMQLIDGAEGHPDVKVTTVGVEVEGAPDVWTILVSAEGCDSAVSLNPSMARQVGRGLIAAANLTLDDEQPSTHHHPVSVDEQPGHTIAFYPPRTIEGVASVQVATVTLNSGEVAEASVHVHGVHADDALTPAQARQIARELFAAADFATEVTQ